jgi:hypothetical protein
MPGAPPNLLKPKLLSFQIFVPKYWRNVFSPFGKQLANLFAKRNCRIVKLNSFSQIVMPNQLAGSSNQIAESKC